MNGESSDTSKGETSKNIDISNYKGIYYNDPSAENHYLDEITGAHFEYRDMVKRLMKAQQEILRLNILESQKKQQQLEKIEVDSLIKKPENLLEERSNSLDKASSHSLSYKSNGASKIKGLNAKKHKEQSIMLQDEQVLLPKIPQNHARKSIPGPISIYKPINIGSLGPATHLNGRISFGKHKNSNCNIQSKLHQMFQGESEQSRNNKSYINNE